MQRSLLSLPLSSVCVHALIYTIPQVRQALPIEQTREAIEQLPQAHIDALAQRRIEIAGFEELPRAATAEETVEPTHGANSVDRRTGQA
jgi:hypothetical protein